MRTVLWLSLTSIVQAEPFQQLSRLAAQRGCRVVPLALGTPLSLPAYEQALAEADAFLVTFPDFVNDDPWRRAVVEAVQAGKRCLVLCSDTDLNKFLVEFDLAVDTGRLVGPAEATGHERVILVRGEAQGAHPLAQALMGPGSTVTMDHARQAWCGKTAQPFMVAPAGTRLVGPGDFFQHGIPEPTFCGGIWPREGTGKVLLLAGGCLFDAPEGLARPVGIAANLALAEGVIRWLRGEPA